MNNYSHLFSLDTASFFRSPVRDIFKKVDLNAIYSFAGGYPSADTFPLEDFRRIMSDVIELSICRHFPSRRFQEDNVGCD